MDFQNDSFFTTAENLIMQESHKSPDERSESNLRTAISRAYYHAFLQCRESKKYDEQGIIKKSFFAPGAHHEVCQSFFQQGCSKEENDIGKDLHNLHDIRKEADYNLEKKITMDQAIDALISSKKISLMLENINQT